MAEPENTPPEQENKNLRYVGHTIPWFVRLLWLGFWILAVAYLLVYFVPAIRQEILTPP
jgi:hypothetical protein